MPIELLSCGYSYHLAPFTNGGRRPLHHYLFRLQSEGDGRAFVMGRMEPVQAGVLLLYQPGDLYELSIEADANGKVSSGDYFVMCRGDWIDEWWGRARRPVLARIGVDESIVEIWKQLILEKRRAGENSSELNVYLQQSLCLHFDRALKERGGEPKVSYAAVRMKRFIEERATTAFKVEDVAKEVDLSASRAAHLFKEAFGQSMMQYAQSVRLSIAVERMKYSLLTLEQIADTSGLGSYPYFHRVFKEKYGDTPSGYRRKWMEVMGAQDGN